jgi:transposase
MLSVGIDAHDRLYVLCVLDERGAVIREQTIKGGPGEVASFLTGLGQPFQVCYEASLGYGVLHDRLAPIAAGVQVAHPGHLRAVFMSKRKNDRIDARKLAKLLFLGEVPRVHVPTLPVREWRVLIEHRRRQIDKRTATKNALRSILRSQAVDAPKGAKLWTKAGRAWIASIPFASPLTALRRDQLLLELEHFERAVGLVTKQLDAMGNAHAGVTLLRTIPGVGPRTAEAVVAYVDDATRFSSPGKAASYFGLVPRLDESAGVSRYGRITKDGPSTVRKYLIEAAWQTLRYNPSMKAFFDRIQAGKKERRGLALVATARHLVEVMVAMLKSGEEWRIAPAAAAA